MIKSIILALLLVSCHKDVKQEYHEQTEDKTAKAAESEMVKAEEKHQDATETKTTTEHEDDAVVVSEPDGSTTVVVVKASTPLKLARGAKVIGTVPLSKTKVESDKLVGAKDEKVDSDLKKSSTETGDKTGKKDGKGETITDTGPGIKFYGACLLGLIIVLAAGYLYLKFAKKVTWL